MTFVDAVTSVASAEIKTSYYLETPTRTDEISADTQAVVALRKSVLNECFPSDHGGASDCSETID